MRWSGSVSWWVAWRGAQKVSYNSPKGHKIGSYGKDVFCRYGCYYFGAYVG
jgi:hypothetical protein